MRCLTLLLLLGASLGAQEPGDFNARKAQARAALDQGQPAQALQLAQPLAKRAPDDYELGYTVAKALRLLGRLPEAETQTQWLLDLRPELPGGRWEAALLREHYADLTGAADLLSQVYRATPATRVEVRIPLLQDLVRVFTKLQLPADAAQLQQELQKLQKANPSHATPAPAPAQRPHA